MKTWHADGPIRSIVDIEALERVPLDQRFESWDINKWISSGCGIAPEKTAITFFADGDPNGPASTLTYAEVDQRIKKFANLFHALGVGRQDSVLCLLPMIPNSYPILLAAMASGIACPVNWMLSAEAILELIVAARAKIVVALGPTPGFDIWEKLQTIHQRLPQGTHILSVTAPGSAPQAETDLDQRAEEQPGDRFMFEDRRERDDLVAYIHSGGTTGTPKLVKLTSGGFVHKCWTVTVTMSHATGDVLFSDMPPFHIAGFLSCIVLPVVLGSAVVIPSMNGARDKTFVANYWKFVERMQITFVHVVPATLTILSQNPPQSEDVRSLHDYSVTGSTALPIEVAKTFERNLGIRILATYGATEFTQNVTQAPRDGEPRYGSAGIRNPYTEIKIVHLDARGQIARACDTDEVGVVLVKSPGTTPGYIGVDRDPTIFLNEGWINNGDLGRLDADGYLWLTGRAKDLIIRSGHNIDPRVIEDVLYQHPAVFMAAAVGKPDAYAGELPVAYVQLREQTTAGEDELRSFVRDRISDPVAVPRNIYITEQMPLTDVRKIAKPLLRLDCARLTFLDALRPVIPAGAELEVRVEPHRQHGTLTTVELRRVAGDRGSLARQITDVMQAYAFPFEISWS
jgi:fatty-acyl-CoA synthase